MSAAVSYPRDRALSSFLDVALGVGFVLSFLTQLRLESSPLGPGELLIVGSVGGRLLLEAPHRASRVPTAFVEFSIFWIGLTLALSLGLVFNFTHDELNDTGLAVHDVVAYLMLATVTLALTLVPNSSRRLRRTQWSIVLSGVVLLVLQVANGWGFISIAGIDPWYWDRFRGWSENPNQFAPLCLMIGLLGVALVEREATASRKLLAGVCAAITLAAGVLSRSNTYSMTLVFALLLLAALKLGRAISYSESRRFPAAAAAAAMIASVALFVTLLSTVVDIRGGLVSAAESIGRNSAEESEAADLALRVYIWEQGSKRGAESWLLGFGPGPHLPIPDEIVAGRRLSNEPINLQHPQLGLAPNFESHNTVIELFVQGGVLAVCLLGWIGGLAVWRSWKAGADTAVVLIAAIAVFGLSAVVFRYPMVWFSVCVGLTSPALATRPARGRRFSRPSRYQRVPFAISTSHGVGASARAAGRG